MSARTHPRAGTAPPPQSGRPGAVRPPARPCPGRHRDRAADGGAGRQHRQRRPAAHSACARFLRYQPGMGRQRLRARLRRAGTVRVASDGTRAAREGPWRRSSSAAGAAGWPARWPWAGAAGGPMGVPVAVSARNAAVRLPGSSFIRSLVPVSDRTRDRTPDRPGRHQPVHRFVLKPGPTARRIR